MSRGQLARTRANFPRMNPRAERRRARRARARQAKRYHAMMTAVSRAARTIGQAFIRMTASIDWSGLARFSEQVRAAAADLQARGLINAETLELTERGRAAIEAGHTITTYTDGTNPDPSTTTDKDTDDCQPR
ncbi:hypothetical protein ACTD5D_00330 [Nocardia takedensis]|uniref:hypothetical protein n=1 Tax=Nocardia takedensis TaxID=259390 RepID=UPI003F76AE68